MSSHDSINLQGLQIDKVLSDDASTKTVAVLGRYPDKDGQAVVLLAKKHFDLNALHSCAATTRLQQQFANDVYHKFSGRGSEEAGEVNVDIIWPASQKHITKYSRQRYIMIEETPQLYSTVVQKYIAGLPQSRIQWVYNILDKKAESERIVYEDTSSDAGFILLPDMKWDQSQVESMYLQALAVRRDVRSIRDLRQSHLLLLENIRDTCKLEISQQYGVGTGEIRMWVHYQPSYYHFHVHIAHTRWNGPSLNVGKAVLLDDVIDNLRQCGDAYYQQKTFVYSLGENEELYKLLCPAEEAKESL